MTAHAKDVERPGWDDYFLLLADTVKLRSTCSRRRVGAVLVDADHRIIGTGYNGSPSGDPHCIDGACPRGKLSYEEQPAFVNYSNCIAVHAEINAIKDAVSKGLRGGSDTTLYVTCPPCEDCAKVIAEYGIGRVVTTN